MSYAQQTSGATRFIVRFDDICPTMNWRAWGQLEEVLRALEIRPIVAVVPDNRDANLAVCESDPGFWNKVREWQSLGWTIGLHGFQHNYSSTVRGLVGLNGRSEFAGIPEEQQAQKLDNALAIFRREGVRPDCWIAPGHSFDATTVRLLRERGVAKISDGYFRRPVLWHGCAWVPQQLWRFREVPAGVWTVCVHINRMADVEVARLIADLRHYRRCMTSMATELAAPLYTIGLQDHLFAYTWRCLVRLRRVAR